MFQGCFFFLYDREYQEQHLGSISRFNFGVEGASLNRILITSGAKRRI